MFVSTQLLKVPGQMGIGLQLLMLAFGFLLEGHLALAADFEVARKAFESGRYDECINQARKALETREDLEDWGVLLTEALIIKGRYSDALSAGTNALASEPRSLRLRWSVRQALLFSGQTAAADEMTADIQRLFTSQYWRYRSARELVIFGRVALLGGMEPKMALDRIYDAAKKVDPKCPDPYLAGGELALEKHDFALAARSFQEADKQLPENPDIQLGLARAYAPSDQRLMLNHLTAALEINSNHLGSLLLLADYNIDAEDYLEAERLLARVESVNPAHPEAWAYRAVIAHLHNQPEAESKARERALTFWPTNPRVDYLIGLKLSQKYRFAEGAASQRLALAVAPGYLPAKSQLAQDLLRLGEETEGWQLADEVQRADAYDVAANNLVTLRDVLSKYQTLTNEHFVLRMHPREASLYGPRALNLLEQARTRLCETYGIEFSKPVLVEMFHEEKDFAVRTFGMPENDGFLGVCFGNVVTANSPGARPGGQFNWESMLWHEFCHVVTLQFTKNKMPRWISEGISVYEERQANPSWGERLNPHYREMILGKDLTPISRLSGAFLAPKSPLHLQFAYYESSLVVEFLLQRFGREKLQAVLRDLGQGIDINETLAKHTVPMPQLEGDFESFARKLAEDMAPGVDWEKPTGEQIAVVARPARSASPSSSSNAPPVVPEGAWELWARLRPTNYWVMLRQATRLTEERKWADAVPLLQKLVQLYPDSTGSSSPYRSLALAHRELGETNAEFQVLASFAEKDDQAPDAYARLMELAAEKGDWSSVLTNAQRYLAVNPLVPLPYRFLAKAGESFNEVQTAIEAYRALIQLDPPNPAEVQFRLAKLLHSEGSPESRRHLLEALEEAPRFREALLLLRQIHQDGADPNPASQTKTSFQQP
jgi:cytochrome c-type biogenesis protein CcmH/NrfG